jgi:hypothetical protein
MASTKRLPQLNRQTAGLQAEEVEYLAFGPFQAGTRLRGIRVLQHCTAADADDTNEISAVLGSSQAGAVVLAADPVPGDFTLFPYLLIPVAMAFGVQVTSMPVFDGATVNPSPYNAPSFGAVLELPLDVIIGDDLPYLNIGVRVGPSEGGEIRFLVSIVAELPG